MDKTADSNPVPANNNPVPLTISLPPNNTFLPGTSNPLPGPSAQNNLNEANPLPINRKRMFNNNIDVNSINLGNLDRFILPLNYLPKKPEYTAKVDPDPSIAENETLYVKNLNDRINPKLTKKLLEELFANFSLKKAIVMKSFWRRGQAWLVFSTKEDAKRALTELNGFSLFGHSLQLNFALDQSHDSSHSKPLSTSEKKLYKKPRRVREKEQQLFLLSSSSPEWGPNVPGNMNVPFPNPSFNNYYYNPQEPQMKMNKILFVENLPANISNNDVVNVFNKVNGFVESRLIPAKKVAFVEFDTELNSNYALQYLQGHLINGQPILISFAKH